MLNLDRYHRNHAFVVLQEDAALRRGAPCDQRILQARSDRQSVAIGATSSLGHSLGSINQLAGDTKFDSAREEHQFGVEYGNTM